MSVATNNAFSLLDDENEDPSALALKLEKEAPKKKEAPKADAAAPKAAAAGRGAAQGGRSATSGRGEGRGRGGRGDGRGRGRAGDRPPREGGAVTEGGEAHPDDLESRGRAGRGGGRYEGAPARGRHSNRGGRRDHEGRPRRREFERHDASGRGQEYEKKGGAGKGNWGSTEEEVKEEAADVLEGEANGVTEGFTAAAGAEGEAAEAPAAEPEPEDQTLTLEDYEKMKEEKRRNLNKAADAGASNKVDMSQFKGMTAYSGRKEDDAADGLELSSKKVKSKKKKSAEDEEEEEEEEEETVDTADLLNFKFDQPGGRGGRGRGRGRRGDGRNRFEGGRGGRGGRYGGRGGRAIPINDDSAFPSLGNNEGVDLHQDAGFQATASSKQQPASAKELNVDAPAFVPQQDGLRPVKTIHKSRSNLFECLDAVPFTPSNGICTPTPTSLHQRSRAQWQTPKAEGARPATSPRSPGSSGKPRSGPRSGSRFVPTQPPQHPEVPVPAAFPAPMAYNTYYYPSFPMPVSPAMGVAGTLAGPHVAPHSAPSSPVFFARHPFDFHVAAHAPQSPSALLMHPAFRMDSPGSPVHPLHMSAPLYSHMQQPFSMQNADFQHVGRSSSKPSSSHADSDHSHEGDSAGDQAKATQAFLGLLGQMQHSTAAPPQEVVDLVALLASYNVLRNTSGLLQQLPSAAAEGNAASDSDSRPSSRHTNRNTKQRHPPRVGADGHLILNARQRRTLRRAQERAYRALRLLAREESRAESGVAGEDTAHSSLTHSRNGSNGSCAASGLVQATQSRPAADVPHVQAADGAQLADLIRPLLHHLPGLLQANAFCGTAPHSAPAMLPRAVSRFARRGVVPFPDGGPPSQFPTHPAAIRA